MEITLNDNREIIDQNEISINELLSYKKYSFRMLVIKLNNELIPKDAYDTTIVKNGDNVSIIHLMSGG
jgi:sulfur carrier protein